MLIQINLFGHGKVEELEERYGLDEETIAKEFIEEFAILTK